MMKIVALLAVVAVVVSIAAAQNSGDAGPRPAFLDPNCDCTYDWIGPHGYYNFWTHRDVVWATYHDADHWSPDPNIEIVPCRVCYVYLTGRMVTFIDQFTHVNEMQIGGSQWDDMHVFVGGAGRNAENIDLRIHYDDVPVIFSMTGKRHVNGQTELNVIGKGFAFDADELSIVARDATADRPDAECYNADVADYPREDIDCPGRPSVVDFPGTEYECEHIRIYHHDAYISCFIGAADVFPQELEVTVTTAKGVATHNILTKYFQ